MAIYNATDLNTKNRHMGGYGNAVVVYGSVTPTAAIFGDVYRPVIIPAGLDVTDVDIVNDDLDPAVPRHQLQSGICTLERHGGSSCGG